jgi:hypothetical protein
MMCVCEDREIDDENRAEKKTRKMTIMLQAQGLRWKQS